MTLRVTVTDIETGDTDTTEVAEGDYVLICHEPCYLHFVQKWPSKGTHQLTIKGHTRSTPIDEFVEQMVDRYSPRT